MHLGEIQIKERAKRKEREIEEKIAQQTGRGDYVTSKNIQGSY
jgi:hypothetical protein